MSTTAPQTKRRRNWWRIIGWSVLALIATLAIAIAGLVWVSNGSLMYAVIWLNNRLVFSTEEFDPTKWHGVTGHQIDTSCARGGMAKDIQKRIITPGMNRQEVEALLGQPDKKDPAEYVYFLGLCSGLRIDYDGLHIAFDAHNKVTHTQIIQH